VEVHGKVQAEPPGFSKAAELAGRGPSCDNWGIYRTKKLRLEDYDPMITSANTMDADQKTGPESAITFFRQSGWMVVATVLGGAFMYAVHKVAKEMPKSEYGVFGTLLQIINLMGIPAAGLQTVFAQQTASILTPEQRNQVRGTFRAVVKATFLLWLGAMGGAFMLRHQILSTLQIAYPSALWITGLVGLTALWLPIILGLLQGSQNFTYLGWVTFINGVARFGAICVIILLLGGRSPGAMVAVLIGMCVAISLGFWQNLPFWKGPTAPIQWRAWLGGVIPLTLGLGAGVFMLGADMIFVQSLFDGEQTGFYAAAGMIGRALVFFTVPMTSVMFPKVVRSAARSEETKVVWQAMAATALMGGSAALGCTLFPWLPLRIVYDPSYLAVAPLVPWFTWCMLPLAMANLLISNLLARERYRVVPWLLVVVAGYGAALSVFNSSFLSVIRTLGVFNILLLAVAAGFTVGTSRGKSTREK
jgi:O-antigen/teichoic acid export membrane protein